MNKPLSIAFFIAGIVLLIFGFMSSDSIASDVSQVATGTPTDHSIWLIVLGVIGLIVGGVSLLRGSK